MDPTLLIIILAFLTMPVWIARFYFMRNPQDLQRAMQFAKRVFGCDNAAPVKGWQILLFLLVIIVMLPSALLARLLKMGGPPPDFCLGIGISPCRVCPRYRHQQQQQERQQEEQGDGPSEGQTPG